MRWWLITDPPCIMSVDNASVKGMDFSELVIDDPDLYMVQWTEGKGEIERQEVIDGSGDGDRNLNGLREAFIDVSPFAGVFQQFLWRMKSKNLLLNQAKKIQIELINELFNSKRQLPYHYPVAAGDYWWNASDDTMGASTALGTQNVTATVNQLIVAVNKLVTDINGVFDQITTGISGVGNTFVSQVNSVVVNGVNAGLVNSLNPIFANLAGEINNDFSLLANEINNGITYTGNLTIGHLNGTVLGANDGGNTINGKLRDYFFSTPDPGFHAASPGISADISHNTYTFGPVSAYTVSTYSVNYIGSVSPGTFVTVAHVPATGVGNVSTSNVQWIPIGSTVPVNVTPAEQTAIINGIAERTNQLNLVRNQKISEVNALTIVDDVIDYDILADWPIIPLPPGYKPAFIIGHGSGTSVAIISEPVPPSGGIPEAPNNGITYGRRNLAWNPALALAGDVLDGGNF